MASIRDEEKFDQAAIVTTIDDLTNNFDQYTYSGFDRVIILRKTMATSSMFLASMKVALLAMHHGTSARRLGSLKLPNTTMTVLEYLTQVGGVIKGHAANDVITPSRLMVALAPYLFVVVAEHYRAASFDPSSDPRIRYLSFASIPFTSNASYQYDQFRTSMNLAINQGQRRDDSGIQRIQMEARSKWSTYEWTLMYNSAPDIINEPSPNFIPFPFSLADGKLPTMTVISKAKLKDYISVASKRGRSGLTKEFDMEFTDT